MYTKPFWVTKENMNDTVVKDGTISAATLCAGKVASFCQEAGIQ